MMTSIIRFSGLLVAAALTACGQTGALYLPDEEVKTPVEIRAPATTTAPTTAAPAETPAPPTPAASPESESDDEDEKSAPPPAP